MPLEFQRDNCIGCRLCQLACAAEHEGVFNPNLARLRINSFYDKKGLIIRSAICDLCLTCVDVCPVEALTFNNGRLNYDQDICTQCGQCIEECPENVIYSKDEGVAICDLCNGSPVCVEWCPHDAISFRGLDNELSR